LRYELFLGSLWFEKDDKEISMDWEWIPLLDFALYMHTLCEDLEKQTKREDIFEFTESDATITFRREEDSCEILTSFSDTSLVMSFAELKKSAQLFCKKVIADILVKNKELKNNRVFKRELKKAGMKLRT